MLVSVTTIHLSVLKTARERETAVRLAEGIKARKVDDTATKVVEITGWAGTYKKDPISSVRADGSNRL